MRNERRKMGALADLELPRVRGHPLAAAINQPTNQYIDQSITQQKKRRCRRETASLSTQYAQLLLFSSIIKDEHLRLPRRSPNRLQTQPAGTRQLPSRPRRRMSAHHEALPQMPAQPPWRQRRRMPRSQQKLSAVPDGEVRAGLSSED